IKEGSFLSEKF
ncbi:unnamed protein product, partial [Allacma fusca]